jgi:DNA-binding CsgD family transcriptional regulator
MATLAPTSRLRGRTVELRTLVDALDRAAGGRPAIVVVEGEAGIGKSRLLAEALDAARTRGFRVVAGRGQDLERNRPFGLLADGFGCARSSPDPRRAAITALLATSAGDRGITTVSSDPGLQFQAVNAFLDLAEAMAGRGPLALGLDDLQWADPSSLLTLGALARRLPDGPVALLVSLRPLPRGGDLERTLEALEAAGGAPPDPRAARPSEAVAELVAETTLPPNLRLTILRRLSFLPDDTLEALRPASILGPSFSLTDLSVTTGRSVLELSSVLAEALAARVLEDDGDRLRFRHDLIHEAIYEDLSAGVRLALHREAGRRLAVAEHLARGATPGDTEAVAWLTRAASEAARRSPAVAAQLLERAVGLADPADPGRDRLLVDRAGALMWSGRLPEAEATLRSLLEREHDPAVEAQARVLLARTLATQGRLRDTLRELERVQRSAALVEELRANLGRGLELIDEAVRLADQSPQRRGHQEVVHLARGNILMGLDRFQEARATLQTGRRISEELGVRWRLPLYQVVLGMERFLAGEWDDALAELQAALDLTEETGERHSTVVTHSVASLIALHRGELRRAGEAAAMAERELAGSDPRFRTHWAYWARALLLEAEGATREALATLAGCWDLCRRSGFAIQYPVLGADLVRLALAAGERARAGRVADAVAEVASGNDVPSLNGAALRCRGLVEDDPKALEAAVDTYRRAPRPLELALAAEDTAAALARRGRSGKRRRPQLGWESLTRTERQVVDLVVEGLSNPQIGERLYVSPRTVQTHVAHVFAKLGISSRAQLAAEATRHRQTPGPMSG